MLSYLQAQTRKNKIPAGVEGVKTANKTGELDASYPQLVENDAAIVYKEGCPYILVVMSQGISNSGIAVSHIVQISKIAYQNIGKETEKEKDKEDKEKNKNVSGEKHVVAVVGGHGNAEGAQKGWYTTGTADTTGTTSPAWTEKDLTKKVADYVKKVMEEQYPQFTVVTDGYSEKNTDRLKIAKQKGAELFIGVHFNSNSNSSAHGTGIYYQQNTSLETENVKLATALLNSITGEMKTDVCEGVSASSYNAFSGGLQEEFGGPAVYTEAAFMSNKGDMEIIAQAGNKGLKAYGNGIIDGILTYYGLENKGYGNVDIEDTKEESTSNGSEQITTTVDTKIYDLQFLAEEEFDKLVEDNDPMALDYYTLDSDWQLITAKWSYNPTDEVQISKNPPINYRSVLSKYTTPFEYLMDFYIDIKDDEFISDFADLVLESEFIIAIRDNVTTTETDSSSYIAYEDGEATDATSQQDFSETVTTSAELTYADNWFVNFSRDITYKIDRPKSDDNENLFELVNTTQKVLGKSSESTSTSTSSTEGPTKTVIDEEGNEITIGSTEYTTTNRHTISVKYAENEGDGEVKSNENKFYKLFNDNPEAQGSLKDTWLVRLIENGERTAQFADLTKYLLYHITNNSLYEDVSIDAFLEKFKYNEFRKAVKNGKISYASIDISDEEIEELCILVTCERGGGTQAQQEYVASVVLNRVLSSEFAQNTVHDVIFAPGQFNPTWDGSWEKNKNKISQVTRDAVMNVIENGGTAGFALFFATPHAANYGSSASWFATLEYLFNDEDESQRYVDRGGCHNFYTTERAKQELAQYVTAGGDIRAICEEITQMYLDRHATYGAQTYGNIQKTYESDTSIVCSTYVSVVLYKSGLISEDIINKYNYHYTIDYPNMLRAAGWTELKDKSDLQPGDVLNKPGDDNKGHTVIYIGDGLIYDQTSCAKSKSNPNPSGQPKSASGYIGNGYVAWRAP